MSKAEHSKTFTTGSKSFDPEKLLDDQDKLKTAQEFLEKNDLRSAIIAYFSLPDNDDYIYHANVSVTLAQVQKAVDAGNANGLHDWYRDEKGKPLPPPPQSDITAYTEIFLPTKSAPNALKSFSSNAKRSSLRFRVADHLLSQRYTRPPSAEDSPFTTIKSLRAAHGTSYPNPSLLPFWTWSCHCLKWAGPDPLSTPSLRTSHHVLPVFMHHFGCVVPSYESLELIRQVARGKTVLDVGSGNGYWTLMLRRHFRAKAASAGSTTGSGDVLAVDSGQSTYRTLWIGDTIVADGIKWLKEARKDRGKADVLLLVYPVVGGDGFTEKIIRAFQGEVVCVVGTQCGNGYTGFKDCVVDEWMAREGERADKGGDGGKAGGKAWEKIAQVPVPSFAGKDDALFVFRRKGWLEAEMAGR